MLCLQVRNPVLSWNENDMMKIGKSAGFASGYGVNG